MPNAQVSSPSRRVAIVGGLRTPFVKSSTLFRTLSARDLAQALVSELLSRLELNPQDVEQVVFGQVVPSVDAPNIARELVLGTSMPRSIDAYSVSRACATGTQALVSGAQSILTGHSDCVLVGGVDSLSRPPITYKTAVIDALMQANSAKGTWSKLKAFSGLRPSDLLPKPPGLVELSTGLSMGQSAEKMATANDVSRQAQDNFAVASHRKASEAWQKKITQDEVMQVRVTQSHSKRVSQDSYLRPDTSNEALAKLRPVFDRQHGTVTAGNSSGLTDGASALVLMSEEKAKALGYTPWAYIKTWAFAACDPDWQLLMGPSFAVPKALDKVGMSLDDMDLIDIHEAFSAQVISNLQAWSSLEFAKTHLGSDQIIGSIDTDDPRLNIYGGSIALGHPFAATGGRQAITMAKELKRRGEGHALITQCAAGGLGAALILQA
jgi:acetyl-CoA acyltransferase